MVMARFSVYRHRGYHHDLDYGLYCDLGYALGHVRRHARHDAH